MAYNYDALYSETRHALGEPTKAFVKFFEDYELDQARVLDVGCGQGRDALFVARLGHRVVGVDLSESGIRDLNADAAKEDLVITGIVADICDFQPDGLFDVVLIDRTLHMLPKDAQASVLERLIKAVDVGGHLLIADERSNLPAFRQILVQDSRDWRTDLDLGGLLFAQRVVA